MISRRLLFAGSVAATAVAGLAGCSGGGSSKPGGPATPTELAAQAINKQDRSKLKDGGTLRLAIDSWIPNYNPYHINGNTVDNSSTLQGFIGTSNWVFAPDGTFKARPEFCKDFKAEVKDGKTVITMHLNPKAKWNNGDPINYADYESAWKSRNGKNPAFEEMNVSTDGWDHIGSIVKGVDDFEMIVTFMATYPDWSSVLSGVMPKALTKDPEAFAAWTDARKTDFGTGPFIVTAADETKGVLTLGRNPNWWGDPAKLETVTLSVIQSNQQGPAFANSELDVVSPIIDKSTYEQCRQRQDGEVRQAAGLQWRHITIHGTDLLADQKLRQALCKGIDRVIMTKADLAGLPVPAEQLQLGNHFFMPNQKGYKDNSGDYKFDKAKAISELEALGWKVPAGAKDGVREKDGKKLSFKYLRLPDTATSATEGKILQANMKEIGCEIVMDDTNSNDFFPNRIRKGLFEIVTFTWQGTPYPMANIRQIYGKGSASNYTGMWSQGIEDLIGKIAVEMDETKRVAMTNECDKLIWDMVMVIPIYSRADYTAVPKALANYGSFGVSSANPEDIGYVA